MLGKLLGRGKEAEVFELGGDVVKLYPPGGGKLAVFREAAILAALEGTGIPAPILRGASLIEGRWGLVMSRADGPSLGDRLGQSPAEAPGILATLVGLHRELHAQPAETLPPLATRLRNRIARAPHLDANLRSRLLDALAARPTGDRLCHGDFHPYNVIDAPRGPVIVDWPDACQGDPAADACRSFLLMHLAVPAFADAYLAAYAAAGDVPATAIRAWLPIVAAARLAENVAGETDRLVALASEA